MANKPQIDCVAKRSQMGTPVGFSFGNADSLRLMMKVDETPLLTSTVDTNVTTRSWFFSVFFVFSVVEFFPKKQADAVFSNKLPGMFPERRRFDLNKVVYHATSW